MEMWKDDGRARPVLGLDVDGVIALVPPARVPSHELRVDAWGRWERTIVVPDAARPAIERLARDFEIVWVSAWGHNAHTSLRDALGLPEQPWRFLPVQFAKAQAVAAYAAGRPWLLVHEGVDEDSARLGEHVVHVDPSCGIGAVDPGELTRLAMNQATIEEGAPR
jgi:hypothetical protein